MEQHLRTMITFGFLVVIIFGLYFFSDWFSKTTGYVLGEDEKLKLAQCLATKQAVFYRSPTCPDCDKQLELFGNSAAEILNVIQCSSADECPSGGVPAWNIGKQTHYGLKQLDELITISECAFDS